MSYMKPIEERISYYTRKNAEYGAIHITQKRNPYRHDRLIAYKKAMHSRILQKSKELSIQRVFLFTFGLGHDLAGHCQPIYAHSSEDARTKMHEMYGNKWAFEYTFDEWKRNREEGYAREVLLVPVIAGESR